MSDSCKSYEIPWVALHILRTGDDFADISSIIPDKQNYFLTILVE